MELTSPFTFNFDFKIYTFPTSLYPWRPDLISLCSIKNGGIWKSLTVKRGSRLSWEKWPIGISRLWIAHWWDCQKWNFPLSSVILFRTIRYAIYLLSYLHDSYYHTWPLSMLTTHSNFSTCMQQWTFENESEKSRL